MGVWPVGFRYLARLGFKGKCLLQIREHVDYNGASTFVPIV